MAREGLGRRIRRLAVLALLAALLLPARGGAEATGDGAPDDDLSLEISLEKDRAYPGQTLTATVTLLVGQIPVRNIQYPVLKGEAYRIGEFAPPRPGSLSRDGREYSAYVFTATLTPLKGGAWQVGPAELACDILVPGGAQAFFGGTEPRTVKLRSAAVDLEILPLPALGRPADFSGAIGRFRVARQAVPDAVRGGDPVTVTTRITGDGDLGAYVCPSLDLPGVRAYPPRLKRSPGGLACEQVLVPGGEGDLLLPAARVSFFDPATARYRTADSGPGRVTVRGRDREPVAGPAAAPAEALPPGPGKADAGSSRIGYALLATLLLLGLGAILVARGRPVARVRARAPGAPAPRPDADPSAWLAEAQAALAAGDSPRFHAAVYRALQAHLGAQYGLAAAAITVEVVDRVLRPAGVGEGPARDYERLFRICDRARFSPQGQGGASPPDTLRLLQRLLRGG
ncbi:MAG: hypothetical protein MUC79_07180 [Thiobacillaceae bacterium]|jgi:hypothetical protein|nr:hypothetical protein [Thiobacillaceae bacterium]